MSKESKQNHKGDLGIIKDNKPFPHDINAEMALLGSMILKGEINVENVVNILGSASNFYNEEGKNNSKTALFYNPKHQRIYSTICELYDNAIDINIISLAHTLRQNKIIEDIGGEAYLSELINSIVTTENLETWCMIVKNCAIRRNLITLGNKISDRGYNDELPSGKLLDVIEKEILEISKLEQRFEIYPIKDLIDYKNENGAFNYLCQLHKKDQTLLGISTGYTDIDDKITGFKPGGMYVFAARPFIDKTSFALNLVSNISVNINNQKSVGFLSLAMSAEYLTRSLLCLECGYSEKDFVYADTTQIERLTEAVQRVENAHIYIDSPPVLCIRELRSKARTMRAQYNIDILFIDDIQLIKAEERSNNRKEEISTISSEIKALSKELHLPIVIFAQLNSEVDKVGAIEEYADVVTYLHNDIKEHQEGVHEININGIPTKLIIEKNRNGKTGCINLLFFPYSGIFTSRARYIENDVLC